MEWLSCTQEAGRPTPPSTTVGRSPRRSRAHLRSDRGAEAAPRYGGLQQFHDGTPDGDGRAPEHRGAEGNGRPRRPVTTPVPHHLDHEIPAPVQDLAGEANRPHRPSTTGAPWPRAATGAGRPARTGSPAGAGMGPRRPPPPAHLRPDHPPHLADQRGRSSGARRPSTQKATAAPPTRAERATAMRPRPGAGRAGGSRWLTAVPLPDVQDRRSRLEAPGSQRGVGQGLRPTPALLFGRPSTDHPGEQGLLHHGPGSSGGSAASSPPASRAGQPALPRPRARRPPGPGPR